MKKQRLQSKKPSIINQIDNTSVPIGSTAFWHLGQSGIAVKSENVVCYIDPYLSNYIEDEKLVDPPGLLKRNFDPPIIPKDVTNADVVLITHEHLDHLDPETIKGISQYSPNANFVCPAPSIDILTELGINKDKIHPAKAQETIQIKGIHIYPLPAKHEKYLLDENGCHYYLGYVLQSNDVTLYHAGDTILFNELLEFLKPFSINVGFLPINGTDWKRSKEGALGNMNFRDAVELAQAANINLLVPVHYDLFQSNTENPAFLVDYLYRHYPRQKFKMMVPGERVIYMKD